MKPNQAAVLGMVLLMGCGRQSGPPPNIDSAGKFRSLVEARKGFQTKYINRGVRQEPVATPPPGAFRSLAYDAPSGRLAAYLTSDPKDGKKHPAIIWMTGGDSNTIGDVWSNSPMTNDQTAAAYRKAGIVMMFPSLRGGNMNHGQREGFLGEVDDVLAAAAFLEKQPHVDPKRIYLGGHSTGGTLVLLVAECSDRFRCVFAFGPAADVSGYDRRYLPFDTWDRQEVELRSPIHWLAGIRSPVFVIEGRNQGNIDSLQAMEKATTNPKVKFLPVEGASHFSVLGMANRLIASKILQDTGDTCNIALTSEELSKLFGK